jgi:hypothetical protein
MSTFPASLQRPALLEFAAALCSRDNALKREECGDWAIAGRAGHIFAYAPGRYQIFVMGWSTKGWNVAKQALAFARLCNDGEDQGGFFLDRLPTKSEATAIRHWLGIPKKRTVSADELARLRSQGFAKAA